MRPIKNANERFDELIVRTLNRIRKPSTAEEITDRMNRELGPDDRPFRSEEVENWLRDPGHNLVHLYWLATRPRR